MGGSFIGLVPPYGFIDVDDNPYSSKLEKEILAEMKELTPERNRFLHAYISQDNMSQVVKDEPIFLDRYMTVQVFRSLQGTPITTQYFHRRMKREFLKESKTFTHLKRLPKYKELAESLTPLDISFETDVSISSLSLLKFRDEASDTIEVASMTMILLKKKLLYLYVYSDYESKADIEWTKSTTKNWVKSLSYINNKPN